MNEIIFKLNLNETEALVFKAHDNIEELYFCDDIEIDLLSDEEYRLEYDCFQYTIRSFIDSLRNAIDNKLCLHPSIKYDLGYMWNEKCSDEPSIDFYFEKIENTRRWIGKNYILFSTPGNFDPLLTTWLYNNEKGEIILQITPNYRWHFQDPAPDEPYCTYEEFIKDYKPVLFRTIPKETALEWICQAESLLKRVEAKGS